MEYREQDCRSYNEECDHAKNQCRNKAQNRTESSNKAQNRTDSSNKAQNRTQNKASNRTTNEYDCD